MQVSQFAEQGPIQYIAGVPVDEPANKEFRRTTARVEFVEELFELAKARYMFAENMRKTFLLVLGKIQTAIAVLTMAFQERTGWSHSSIARPPLKFRIHADCFGHLAWIHRRMAQP